MAVPSHPMPTATFLSTHPVLSGRVNWALKSFSDILCATSLSASVIPLTGLAPLCPSVWTGELSIGLGCGLWCRTLPLEFLAVCLLVQLSVQLAFFITRAYCCILFHLLCNRIPRSLLSHYLACCVGWLCLRCRMVHLLWLNLVRFLSVFLSILLRTLRITFPVLLHVVCFPLPLFSLPSKSAEGGLCIIKVTNKVVI